MGINLRRSSLLTTPPNKSTTTSELKDVAFSFPDWDNPDAKELTRVRAPDGANEDGSTDEVSGAGYFMGEYSGFEITIKSQKLYPNEPGNWAYYTFGHQPEPYNQTAMTQPAEACNACHEASAAEDFVFTQFYPVLRAAKANR